MLLVFEACNPRLQQDGAVSISFSAGAMETRSDADDVADGGKIYLNGDDPDLTVLICSGDAIAAVYSNDGTGAAAVSGAGIQGSLQSKSGNTATVRFTNLNQGNYTVYVLANTGGLWAMTDGTDPVAVSGITAANIESLYFSAGPAIPDPGNNGRMPLTAKGALTVDSNHNGTVSLNLHRCVARVSVILINNYQDENGGKTLALNDFSCSVNGIAPVNGYLVPRTPDIFSASSGNLSMASSEAVTLSAGGTRNFTKLVYPSEAASGYTCSLSFSINSDNHSWTDLAITDELAQRVTSLSRNQQLVVTIRIGAGKMVSFNFEVHDWSSDTLPQDITFD